MTADSFIRITPIRATETQHLGWYLHLDWAHQHNTPPQWNQKPYGGWFYEKCSEGWRTDTGHLEGPDHLSETDWVIGPISIENLKQSV